MNETGGDRWLRLQAGYDTGRDLPSVGIIGLATDRVGIPDFEDFLSMRRDRLELFSTRIPMSPSATPETLAALGEHLAEGAGLLVPGSRLDAVAFSCTSGTVAVGIDAVKRSIQSARPGIKISTPMEAGAAGLRELGCRRIALLTPYRVATAELVAGYLEAAGLVLAKCATFDLDGDPQMNRVSAESIARSAMDLAAKTGDFDGMFISCTGLRTFPVVARIESILGKPVVTSNQALAWDCLRQVGLREPIEGQGRLFTEGLSVMPAAAASR
ncbi:maleate cis-trans isomerase family protein [Rhodoligotrophos defluvii]|uniref:maleate cis-trans isomerase family protein n=1 Tax=Rhodoligotrophos defluvii TaxID=2561934 RepID=UPI0010CA0F37|nr:aspartate/glutamate racemase family protein [Rhodoligotrophos defluvii]